MGYALDSILFAKSGLTGGAYEALSPGSGDTFTVRNATQGSAVALEELWALDSASPCLLSIKSPNFHDQVRGLLMSVPSGAETGRDAAEPSILFPGPETVPLVPADTFTVEADGTAADDVLGCMLVRYDDLPNANAGFVDWPAVQARLKTMLGILVQPTTGAADWGDYVALDSVDDRLKAGSDYAILGALSSVPVSAIGIVGPFSSNYRLAMPGSTDPVAGGGYFIGLSNKYQRPHIGVFSGTDKSNVLVNAVDVAGGNVPDITLILAQLN